MEPNETIKTKLLVYDNNAEAESTFKSFCEHNALISLKASSTNPVDILDKNTDLGAIVISNDYEHDGKRGMEMAKVIHDKRPELPIFFRLDNKAAKLDDPDAGHVIADTFSTDAMHELNESLNKHLFTKFYPVVLIRGIQEVSEEAIQANIKNCKIEVSSPYLVKDQIIYGELLSLIPMESNWYRGYMMLQTTENEAMDIIKQGYTTFTADQANSRYIVSLLNEITNLIWGGIKSRFNMYSDDSGGDVATRTQVPISINHHQKFISFGTTEPQLCFHYVIKDPNGKFKDIDLYQKFVFNLSWYPEDFKEADLEVDKLVDSGELELF